MIAIKNKPKNLIQHKESENNPFEVTSDQLQSQQIINKRLHNFKN